MESNDARTSINNENHANRTTTSNYDYYYIYEMLNESKIVVFVCLFVETFSKTVFIFPRTFVCASRWIWLRFNYLQTFVESGVYCTVYSGKMLVNT